MTRLIEQILVHTAVLPEGTPVSAKSLLHLGNRAAVDQALSRMSERGQLIRAGRGVYLRPIATRFGTRAPSVDQAVAALAAQMASLNQNLCVVKKRHIKREFFRFPRVAYFSNLQVSSRLRLYCLRGDFMGGCFCGYLLGGIPRSEFGRICLIKIA